MTAALTACFVSYAREDAAFVDRLAAALARRRPPVATYIDRRDLQAGEWVAQLSAAIRDSRAFLFVLSRASTAPGSVCRDEFHEARYRYRKDIVLLRVEGEAALDLATGLQEVDFCAGFSAGLRRLVQLLRGLDSAAWQLQRVEAAIEDELRRARRATDAAGRRRSRHELAALRARRDTLAAWCDAPAAARRDSACRAEAAVEQVRRGGAQQPHAGRPLLPLPQVPTDFQDRAEPADQLRRFLQSGTQRLALVFGRSGIGKTALACKVLSDLLQPRRGSGAPPAVVPLDAAAAAAPAARMLATLGALLPPGPSAALAQWPDMAQRTTRLLEGLAGRPVVVLVDGADVRAGDAGRYTLADAALHDVLVALLSAPDHAVKVIVTSQALPSDLLDTAPARQVTVPLERGLPLPDAERYLHALDGAGDLGLRGAGPELMTRIVALTDGMPQPLQRLVARLRADRLATVASVLDAQQRQPDLGREVFDALEPDEAKVLQIVAAFVRPLPPGAVDFVAARVGGIADPAGALARLGNLLLVARDGDGRISVHDADRALLRSRQSPDGARRLAAATADFHRQARAADGAVGTWSQADNRLAEVQLRLQAQQPEAALEGLEQVRLPLALWGHAHALVGPYEAVLRHPLELPREARARASLADLLRRGGAHDAAIGQAERALAHATALSDRALRAECLTQLARCHWVEGRIAQALEACTQGLRLAPGLRDATLRRALQCRMQAVQGQCRLFTGDLDGALAALRRAVHTALALGEPEADRYVGVLGLCQAYRGRDGSAMASYHQALALADASGHQYGRAMHRVNLAELLIGQGRHAQAAPLLAQAQEMADAVRSPRLSGWCRWCLGLSAAAQGRYDEACTLLGDTLERFPDAMNDDSIAMLLGLCSLRAGQPVQARAAFERALRASQAMLRHNPRYFFARDALALSWAGLAALGEPGALARSRQQFRQARATTRAPGYVAHVRRLLDHLAPVLPARAFAGLQAALAGTALALPGP